MFKILLALPLKTLLRIDAATCLAMGLLLLAASGPLATLTALPPALLFWAGALLLPIAAFMGATALAAEPHRLAVGFIVIGNIFWSLASIALPVAGLIAPNGLGLAFLVAQAAVVLLLAELELSAMRRGRAALA